MMRFSAFKRNLFTTSALLTSLPKWMDLKLAKICLIGIQPESVEIGLEMTDRIIGKLDELVDRVFQKLKAWGATCALQSP
jgi:hydrogenase maturation protease